MITFWNLELAFAMVVLIAGLSNYVGVLKVLKIEPFDIFRGSQDGVTHGKRSYKPST